MAAQRSVIDLDDELGRIWALVGELSEQLNANRALVAQLKSRSDNVKGQAAHAGTGFPLRRFNLDISEDMRSFPFQKWWVRTELMCVAEEFSSELEAFSSHLVLENQQLQHENKQLNALLKEYEQTLETVMGKFRGVAHASQQHDLSLHSYYTSLLQTLQTAHSSAQLHDNTSLSLLLTRLSTLLRSALRSLGGEEAEADLESYLPGLLSLANGSRSGHSQHASDPSSSPPSSPGKSVSSGRKSILPRAPSRPAPFPGSLSGAKGGYSGTEGKGDWALEREMEILRLEEENKSLREMLGISEELPPLQEEPEEPPQSPVPDETRRKSSLTVEELEAGAEKEAEMKLRAETGGIAEAEGLVDGVAPGSAPVTQAQADSPLQRPVFNESVLGFQAQMTSPEEAIEDDEEGG
ncbi:hypothetical protein JCM24511_04838 [Saitozyma sp. JCM 24511]|nr:hypothetical protein JCM24511_04838 [Saitozyma sp. JCM 24511]